MPGVWVGVDGELLERVFRTLVVRQGRRRCQGQSYGYMLEYIIITVIRSRKLGRNPNVSEAFCASIIRDGDVDLMTERERWFPNRLISTELW